MKEFRLIVAGSRDFKDYELLERKLNHILSEKGKDHKIIIVSGHARGADSFGEKYARGNNYTIEGFSAKWEKHGKRAGIIRNREMAIHANALIVFWDGESPGTRNMIENMKELEKPVRVVIYK